MKDLSRKTLTTTPWTSFIFVHASDHRATILLAAVEDQSTQWFRALYRLLARDKRTNRRGNLDAPCLRSRAAISAELDVSTNDEWEPRLVERGLKIQAALGSERVTDCKHRRSDTIGVKSSNAAIENRGNASRAIIKYWKITEKL